MHRKSERIVLVTHSEAASSGAVGDALRARGYATDVCCPLLGDPLPRLVDGRPEGFVATVVFGGPMSVGDTDEHPFLTAETEWIGAQSDAGVPILGICLGAQLLAQALGGRVWRHSAGTVEVGYHAIFPAQPRSPLFPAPFHAYQWHRDGFDLPSDAVLLACGETFYNQAFRYGRSAYGVQFHPEMRPDILQRWVTHENAQRDLARPEAQSADEQQAAADRHDPAVRAWFEAFLDVWLQSDLSRPEPEPRNCRKAGARSR